MTKTLDSDRPDTRLADSAVLRPSEAAKYPGETDTARTPGRKLGYARVSTNDGRQVLDRQIDSLNEAGVDEIYTDQMSGAKASRPGLDRLWADLRPGDKVVVHDLTRLGRDTRQLLLWADELRERGVELQIVQLGIDTSTPGGKLIFTVLAGLAQMEREIIQERVREGLAAARRRGRVGGRPPALNDAQRAEVHRMRAAGRTVGEIAEILGCSPRTVRRVANAPTT